MKSLPRRRLGTSDLELTPVGLGTWAIGGPWLFGWGSQDDNESIRTITHGIDAGINWIDTAPIYGHGHAEEVIGRALRKLPQTDRPLIFTKCGMRWEGDDLFARSIRDLTPRSIRTEVEGSLRRLGVERIDLYQFHWPDLLGTPVEESWGEMERLIKEGKIRAAGVCNFGIELLGRANAVRHVDSLQTSFSLVSRNAAVDLLPWVAANGTGFIVYSPMQSGLLSGEFNRERVAGLPDDDWRKRDAQFMGPQLERNLELVDSLRRVGAEKGVSVPALAVAWTLAWPGVSGAIVGARSTSQIDGWIEAASLKLSAAELDRIDELIERTGAGEGPRRPAPLEQPT